MRDRNFLFAWQGIANHDKIIKSLKYGPSRAQLQHVVAAPGWGFGVKAVVGIKNNFGKRRIKTRVVFIPEVSHKKVMLPAVAERLQRNYQPICLLVGKVM